MTNTQNEEHETEMGMHSQKGFGLEPLFTWQGLNVYPFCGAEGDGEGDDGPDSESDDGEGDDTGEGDSGDGSRPVTREDFDKLQKQLSASDKNRSAAEKKLKEIEDAKKDELTKATERAEELEKTVAQRDKDIADLRLQNAFLMADTGITWHDPADALALAERQGYLAEVVGEDGKVDAAKLKTKMQELAKAKKHLVKDEGSTGGGRSTSDEPKKPTGQKVGSRGSSGSSGGDKLPSRYDKFLNR